MASAKKVCTGIDNNYVIYGTGVLTPSSHREPITLHTTYSCEVHVVGSIFTKNNDVQHQAVPRLSVLPEC